MRNAMIIDEKDNVIVAVELIEKGTEVVYEVQGRQEKVLAAENVNMYHKLARNDIKKGEKIIKYGEYIGEAGADIPAGSHVHIHNVLSVRERVMD